MQSLALIDKFEGDFADVALMMEAGRVSPDLTEEEMAQLKPEQYRDVFEKPNKFNEAWNHPSPFQRKRWREGILKELRKMIEHKVWVKVKRSSIPRDRRLVKCKWVFEIKRNGIFRCRLVACGYSQVGGVDFDQIYNSVVNDVTFRIMLTAKLVWGLQSGLFDVETAFLNADMDKELYMAIPEGLDAEADECLKLLKATYGTVQAARAFGLWFAEKMKKIGFKQSSADPCLFIRRNELGLVMVIIYIDDGYFQGDKPAMDQMIEQLRAEGIKLKVEDSMEDYLSCQVLFSKDGKRGWLGQPHMVKKLLKSFGDDIKGLRKTKTPGTPGLILTRPETEDNLLDEGKQRRLRSGVGMLLYLVKHSRPDIANAVRELTKCMDKGTLEAFKELLRVIKFVADTKDLGLKMFPTIGFMALVWEILLLSDSDWAGDKQTRRSVSGFIMFLCGVPIMWRSKQQGQCALSSTEAEYYAVSEAVKEILFVVQVLLDLGIAVKTPIIVKVDNMGAVFMTNNASSSARTRHVDTRWHFIRELQDEKLVEVVFVRTQFNWSDGMTKNVATEVCETNQGEMVVDKGEL